jgi:hypothetical protein
VVEQYRLGDDRFVAGAIPHARARVAGPARSTPLRPPGRILRRHGRPRSDHPVDPSRYRVDSSNHSAHHSARAIDAYLRPSGARPTAGGTAPMRSPDFAACLAESRRCGPVSGAPQRAPGDKSPDAQPCSPDAQPCSPDAQPCSPDAQPCSPDAQPCSPNAQPCSPDAQSCSPDAQPCSPDAQRCSPDAQPCSPGAQRCSPDAQPCSPDAQPCSPDAQPCSPDAQPCSPDAQPCSPDAQPCSPDARTSSPNARACSPTPPEEFGAAPRSSAVALIRERARAISQLNPAAIGHFAQAALDCGGAIVTILTLLEVRRL